METDAAVRRSMTNADRHYQYVEKKTPSYGLLHGTTLLLYSPDRRPPIGQVRQRWFSAEPVLTLIPGIGVRASFVPWCLLAGSFTQ